MAILSRFLLCFNPCSGGLEMAAPYFSCDSGLNWMFQSLFWWIGDGGCFCVTATRLLFCGFNPCSGGLEMAAAYCGATPPAVILVSILVLVDWRWRPRAPLPSGMSWSGFQSLFWWIGDGGDAFARRSCELGRFQSLFWWIGDGGRVLGRVLRDRATVSILVLVDWRWRRDSSAVRAALMACFNPCSGGLEMAAGWWPAGVAG